MKTAKEFLEENHSGSNGLDFSIWKYGLSEDICLLMEQYAHEYARSIQMKEEDMREWEKLYKEKVNPRGGDDFYEGMECYKQQILNKL